MDLSISSRADKGQFSQSLGTLNQNILFLITIDFTYGSIYLEIKIFSYLTINDNAS